MATAGDIILDAYSLLGIRASETSLQADEIQNGLTALNNYLAELEPVLQLGAAPVFKVSDEVRIPRNANGAVTDGLALKLGPRSGRVISPDLRQNAIDSMDALLTDRVFIGDVDMPDTLPTGSGNDCFDTGDDGIDRKFFPEKHKRRF